MGLMPERALALDAESTSEQTADTTANTGFSDQERKEMEERVNFVSKFEVDLNKETSEPYLFEIDASSLKLTVAKGKFYTLTINGTMIDHKLLGKTQLQKESGDVSYTYYGVKLQTGENIIQATIYDQLTNQR